MICGATQACRLLDMGGKLLDRGWNDQKKTGKYLFWDIGEKV